MVAMEVADENAGDDRGRDVGKNELPLRPFAGIEEESLVVPPDEIGAVIPKAGRLLARAAEDDNISCAHNFTLCMKNRNCPK